MSKKWTTFLVAAVIGAMLLPAAAFANCRFQTVTTVTVPAGKDTTTPTYLGDPVPIPVGDHITQITPNGTGAAGELLIDAEGVFERSNDILVTDDAVAPACFGTIGEVIQMSIGAVMTSPAPGAGVPTAPANLDVYDSNGINGLGVSATSSTAIGGGNTQQTIIQVQVTKAGTAGDLTVGAAGAAFRVKNLRFNASTISGTDLTFTPSLPANPAAALIVDATNADKLGNVQKLMTTNTNNTGQFCNAGFVAPSANGGFGAQNAGGGLSNCGGIMPNVQETVSGTFRTAGGPCNTTQASAGSYATAVSADTCVSGVANDSATVATSITYATTGQPSAVTQTWPGTITTAGISGGVANSFVTFTATARGGSPLAFTGATGSGSQTVVYDTTTSGTAAAANGFTLETADNADPGTAVGNATVGTTNPNCAVSGANVVSNNAVNNGGVGTPCDNQPKVGVFVNNPSGNGRVTIFNELGRGVTSDFTGDDVAATGVFPAYSGSGRRVVRASGRTLYTITPIRTTMLFPYVVTSTAGGFNTGIAISNTCTDTGVFLKSSGAPTTAPTCNNAAGITFFFDGVNQATGAPYAATLSTDLTLGGTAIPTASCPLGNLDSNGRLRPGTTFACGAAQLLALISGSPATFTGHVFAVEQAQGGHGFAVTFAAGGAPAGSANAVVMESNSGTRGLVAGDGVLGN